MATLSDASDEDLYDDGTDIIDVPKVPQAAAEPPSAAGAPVQEAATTPAGAIHVHSEPVESRPRSVEQVETEEYASASFVAKDSAPPWAAEEATTEPQARLSEQPEAWDNDREKAALLLPQPQRESDESPAPPGTRTPLLAELEQRRGVSAEPGDDEDEPTNKLRVDRVARARAAASQSLADELAPSLAAIVDEPSGEIGKSLADELEPDEQRSTRTLRELAQQVAPSQGRSPLARTRSSAAAKRGVPASISPRAPGIRSSRAPAATSPGGSPRASSRAHAKPAAPADSRRASKPAPIAAGRAASIRPAPRVVKSAASGGELLNDSATSGMREQAAVTLDTIALSDVQGLQDLPQDAQVALVKSAKYEKLARDEELNVFAVALVLQGTVNIMPTIADAVCAQATVGEVVFTKGHLTEGVLLRVVASEDDTRLAFWSAETLGQQTVDCPWVEAELRTIADRYQALAGAAMGLLGERLDDNLRAMVTRRCEVVLLGPNETLLRQGDIVNGMYILGGGRIELLRDQTLEQQLNPGEFLFTAQVLAGGGAPHSARAGSKGALLLRAERMVAHELLVSVPPLLEMLAG